MTTEEEKRNQRIGIVALIIIALFVIGTCTKTPSTGGGGGNPCAAADQTHSQSDLRDCANVILHAPKNP